MLKITKSKAFKVAGLFIAMAMVLTVSAAKASAATTTTTSTTTTVQAAAFNYSGTMRVGMKGPGVSTLQAALNSVNSITIVVDGSFGPATKAAVVAFQRSHGLTADGIVGPKSGAALSAATVAMITVPSTGPLCPNGMTLASNCTAAPSTTTTTTTTTVAGCSAGAMYNSMTGAPCANTTPVSTTGPLSINNVTPVSGYVATLVGVGQQDKIVGDLRIITGAGGTANLTGINLSFLNKGTGDFQFIKYAQNVSVWLNGKKVGSIDASQFSQYNSIYSAFVSTSGATLNPNSTNDLQIAVSALPVIDSANTASTSVNTWLFNTDSIRYTDSTGSFQYTVAAANNFAGASGLVTSNTSPNASFSFAAASSAQSIKLTAVKDSTDATDHVVVGNATAPTYGTQLAVIDLQAQGTAITVRKIPVTIKVANTGTGGVNVNALVNTLKLYSGSVTGTPLDSESTNGTAASGTKCTTTTTTTDCVVTFQNFTLTVPANGQVALAVTGDFNSIDQTVNVDGANAQISVTTANVAAIQAYDANNNLITGTSYLTGSTTGNLVYVYVNGIQVASTGAASSQSAAPGGANTHSTVTMTIPFSVTAFGATAYMSGSATAATAAAADGAENFCTDTSVGTCQASGTAVITYAGNDTLNATGNNNYQINPGQTRNFILQITLTPAAAASFRGILLDVDYNAADNAHGGTGWKSFTAGLNSNAFKTPYVAGQ